MASNTITEVAGQFNEAVGDVALYSGDVVNHLASTAGAEGVVSAAVIGGAGYYAYRKRNSE